MSVFFQIKIKPGNGTNNQLAFLGLSSDHWVIRNAMWCEDYFDIDHEEIAHLCEIEPRDDYRTMVISDNSEDGQLVVCYVREVPPLIRQGNSEHVFIIPDDTAYQITRELIDIANEAVPPDSGDAASWFCSEIERFASN